MSKAEDRAAKKALETFPILFSERNGYDKTNLQQERRNAYEKGYHQAEQDLELTWEDISTIRQIMFDYDRTIKNEMTLQSNENYCKEVLKRYKETKKVD